jgi:hypothetical protein
MTVEFGANLRSKPEQTGNTFKTKMMYGIGDRQVE